MTDVWELVHAERAALIADLRRVDAADWDRASLCAGWILHDVVAHLVNTAKTTRLGFVREMLVARFDFDRVNARGVQRERGATPEQTLDRLTSVATLSSTPPAPLDTRLVEEIVHGEDIRRPLGLTRQYPSEAVARALRLQAKTSASFGGAKDLVAGFRLTATDADVTIGQGADVTGPALALLLAVCGRRLALGELDGPGAADFAAAVARRVG